MRSWVEAEPNPSKEEGGFKELAGSASKYWTVDEMLKRLDELRRENV